MKKTKKLQIRTLFNNIWSVLFHSQRSTDLKGRATRNKKFAFAVTGKLCQVSYYWYESQRHPTPPFLFLVWFSSPICFSVSVTVSYQNGKLHSASVQQIFTSIVPLKRKIYIIQAQPEKPQVSEHHHMWGPALQHFFFFLFFSHCYMCLMPGGKKTIGLKGNATPPTLLAPWTLNTWENLTLYRLYFIPPHTSLIFLWYSYLCQTESSPSHSLCFKE